MADTATSADIMRNQGLAHVHTLGPQKAVEALYMTPSGTFELKSSRKCHVAALPHLNLPCI